MSFTCLPLKGRESLFCADLKEEFMIAIVNVTDSWELYIPTVRGDVPLSCDDGWEMFRVSLRDKRLVRADNKEMDPGLGSTISQAIRDGPQIGGVWIIQFTLFFAVEATTRSPWSEFRPWEEITAIARQQLASAKEEPRVTPMHCDVSTEHDMKAVSGKGNDNDLIGNYQKMLEKQEKIGKRKLEIAKSGTNGV